MSSIALKVRIMENPQAINLTLRLLVPFRSLNPVNLAEISHHAPQSVKQYLSLSIKKLDSHALSRMECNLSYVE